ncbi:MAG: hypothetical protein AAB393_09125, partial [Bacteroidota bacterium]
MTRILHSISPPSNPDTLRRPRAENRDESPAAHLKPEPWSDPAELEDLPGNHVTAWLEEEINRISDLL